MSIMSIPGGHGIFIFTFVLEARCTKFCTGLGPHSFSQPTQSQLLLEGCPVILQFGLISIPGLYYIGYILYIVCALNTKKNGTALNCIHKIAMF